MERVVFQRSLNAYAGRVNEDRLRSIVKVGVVWCGVAWCGVVWCGVV